MNKLCLSSAIAVDECTWFVFPTRGITFHNIIYEKHYFQQKWPLGQCYGLMDRALDLKPEVIQGCGFESRLWQEVSTTEVRPLGKAPNPQLLPRRRNVGCPLLHLDGLNAENAFHSSLYSV